MAQLLTGEQVRAMGGNPDTMISIGGKYDMSGASSGGNAYTDQYNSLVSHFRGDTDAYVNDLLKTAQGDTDFAIKQLKAAHDTAVGGNDTQTAQFLENVADKLEEKVGRIPYDYQVGVERATKSADTALSRLAQDEQVWKQEKAITDKEATTSQQEGLLKRGILSGTRERATGLAGSEVKTMDTKLQAQLDAYDRALGRSREDIGTAKTQTIADLTTGARRGVQDTQTTYAFGTEAQQRALDAKKKEAERIRKQGYETAPAYALTRTTQTNA